MRKLCLVLTAAALLAVTSPAFAAEPPDPPITNPMDLVDNATPEPMAEMMRQLGATQVEIKGEGDQKSVTFFDGPVPYSLGFGICNIRPNKCLAMLIIVVVDPGATNFPLEALNGFNKQGMFTTLVKLDGNRFAAGHMLLVDGGVTRKNIAINVASFIITFHEAMRYLQSQMVAGTYPKDRAMLRANGQAPLRFVKATPQEMAQAVKALSSRYQTTLRRFR